MRNSIRSPIHDPVGLLLLLACVLGGWISPDGRRLLRSGHGGKSIAREGMTMGVGPDNGEIENSVQ